jgi:hypothetical protein
MPKNQVSLDEIKVFVEKLKNEMWNNPDCIMPPKDYANKYLNKVIDKLKEYRY